MTSPTAVQRAPVDPAIGAAIEVYTRLNTIRNVLAPDLNDQELQLFAMVAERSRLDPFAKQIYAIKRKGRVTFQTGIDGFRSSAEETGEYRGSDEAEYGDIVEKPFPHPEWARVVVHRQFADGTVIDQSSGKVYFDELYPGDEQGFQWRKMPRTMLAKCAEAVAFRKAFPRRFSDVYTAEEMDQADAADRARPVAPTAAARVAERRAQLEAQAGGSTTGDPAAGMPVPADVQTGTSCPVASPKGEPCLVQGQPRHTEHRNGVKRWSTPQQAQRAAGSAQSHEHGRSAMPSDEPVDVEAAAGVVTAPAADLVDTARQVFGDDIAEGEFTPVGQTSADVQAGLDLLSNPPALKG